MATELMRSERGLTVLAAQLGSLWSRQPLARRVLGAAVAIGLAGAVAYLAVAPPSRPWVPISTITDATTGRAEAALLEEAGIGTRLRGKQLMVAAAEEAAARRLLATSAYAVPAAQSAEQGGSWRAMLGRELPSRAASEIELAKSLSMLAPIRSARVHLTPGKSSPFADRVRPPSAAVVVHLRDGATLSPELVGGIQQLVASAVEGLPPSGVSVLDQHGNAAKRAGGDDARAALEAELGAKVRAVLEPLLGAGRVIAVATVALEATANARAKVTSQHLAVLVDPQALQTTPDAAELATWSELVRGAVGIDETRGDRLWIEVASFAAAPPSAPVAPAPPDAPAPTVPASAPSAPAFVEQSGPRPTRGAPLVSRADAKLWLAIGAGALACLALGLAVWMWRRLRRAHRALAEAAARPAVAAPSAQSPTAQAEAELARASAVLAAEPEATAAVLGDCLQEAPGAERSSRARADELMAPAPQSAAIALLVLPESLATDLLGRLSPVQLGRLRAEVAAIGDISDAAAHRAIVELARRVSDAPAARFDPRAYLRRLATRAFGAERAANLLEPSAQDEAVRKLERADARDLAALLRDDTPALVTTLLTRLTASKVAEVLGELPRERAVDLWTRLSRTTQVSPEAAEEVAQALAQSVDATRAPQAATAFDGRAFANAVLDELERGPDASLVEQVRRGDAHFAAGTLPGLEQLDEPASLAARRSP